MDRKYTHKHGGTALALSYRRAGILDAVVIFQLIQEGAEAGSFSDAFIQRTGSVQLLVYILRSVARQRFQSHKAKAPFEWLIISKADGEEVGFLKLSKGLGASKDSNLELIAIYPEHRNQGIGNAVLDHLHAQVPMGGQLYVHCTKFARAMQHILKRRGLKRNVKFGVPNLEEYQSHCAKPP